MLSRTLLAVTSGGKAVAPIVGSSNILSPFSSGSSSQGPEHDPEVSSSNEVKTSVVTESSPGKERTNKQLEHSRDGSQHHGVKRGNGGGFRGHHTGGRLDWFA